MSLRWAGQRRAHPQATERRRKAGKGREGKERTEAEGRLEVRHAVGYTYPAWLQSR